MINPFKSDDIECFLSCPRGLEEITANGIRDYCKQVELDNGGVKFSGDFRSLYKVNLYSRTGMYALVKLFSFKAKTDDDLYSSVISYPWHEWLTSADTFAIRTRVRSRYFDNSQYSSLKVKDAIVDCIRKKTGNRPDVDKTNPKYSLFLFIFEDSVNIYLNSSGYSLSKRGYREKIHKASLNEALASGIILLSGWKKEEPFYDPMCGSGTFPIEAAMIAKNIPSGYYRKSFAFHKWHYFDNRLWNEIVREARENISHDRLKIFGYDNLGANIDLSRQNSLRILIHNHMKFKRSEFSDFMPKEPGMIIMNPPYGVRIGDDDELSALYELMGNVLKTNCQGSKVYILSGTPELSKNIGLKAKKNIILKNGKLDCRLLYFPILAGKYDN